MRVSVIAAVARNGVIGRDGTLPWHLPADLKRFKALTMGHHLLMGRRTWESVGRPLPGRRIVVLTRRSGYRPGGDGVEMAGSLEEGLERAAGRGEEEAFVAGGAAVYREALARADRLYLTHVEAEVEGDVRFPELPTGEWDLVSEEIHPADERHAHPFRFAVYERRREGGDG